MDNAYEVLAKFKGLSDLNNNEIYLLNSFGYALNNAQGRVLGCEKKQFIIICVICGVAGLTGWIFPWLIPFVYYMALLTPRYKADNPEPWYLLLLHRVLYGLGIGMFIAVGQGVRGDFDTVYVDAHGRRYKNVEDRTIGCAMYMILLMVALVVAPLLIIAQCLVYFIRNYLSNR